MKKTITLLVVVMVVLGVTSSAIVSAQDDALVIWADEINAPIIEGFAEGFTEEFGVDVQVQQLQFGDIRGEFITAAPAGEGPDIILGAHD